MAFTVFWAHENREGWRALEPVSTMVALCCSAFGESSPITCGAANQSQSLVLEADGDRVYLPAASTMKRLVLTSLVFSFALPTFHADAQPANDFFTNRIFVTQTPYTWSGSTSQATREPGEPYHAGNQGGHSVWWSWEAPARGQLSISTAGTSFDTLVGIYIGTNIGELFGLTFSSTTWVSPLRFWTQPNTRYEIALDGMWGSSGFVNLSLQFTPTPANDLFTNRLWLTGLSNQVSGTTAGARHEPGEPDPLYAGNDASVWYAWTVPLAGAATVRFVNASYDAVYAVYRGSSVPGLAAVAAGTRYQTAAFRANAGETLAIAVDGRSGSPGEFNLQAFVAPSAPNDLFAKRIVLSGTNAVFEGSSRGASMEPGEPTHNYSGGGRSVWWSWTAPGKGLVRLGLVTNNPSGVLAVYRGQSVGSLIQVGSLALPSSSPLTFWPTPGTSYSLALDASTDPPAIFQLSYLLAPANDDFTNRTVVAGASNSVAGTTFAASVEPFEGGWPGGSASVWYEWTPPFTGSAWFEVNDSSSYSFSIYTNSPTTGLRPVTPGSFTGLTLQALAGRPYLVRVTQSYGSFAGAFTLRWSLTPPEQRPGNDNFSNRTTIPFGVTTVTGTLQNATSENGEFSTANIFGGTIWWSWRPETNCAAFIGGDLFPFGPSIAVYTGTNFPNLTSVTSGEYFQLPLKFEADPDKTYAIQVGSPFSSTNDVTLTITTRGPPPNDFFASRTVLAGDSLSVTGANYGARKEPGEPNHVGSTGRTTVWYEWTAPSDGPATIAVTAATWDPALAVYTGTVLTNLFIVATNDDYLVSSPDSRATFNAVAAQTYLIALAGRGGTSGEFTLTLIRQVPPTVVITNPPADTMVPAGSDLLIEAEASDPDGTVTQVEFSSYTRAFGVATSPPFRITLTNVGPGNYHLYAAATDNDDNTGHSEVVLVRVPPPNDDFTNRTVIDGSTNVVYGTISGAAKEPGEPDHAGNAGGNSVWWTWTAPSNGAVTLTTAGSTFYALLAVYTGPALSNLTLVASDNGSFYNSRVTFFATAGTDYAIAVDEEAGYQHEAGTVVLTLWSAPPNDYLTNRISLTGTSNTVTTSNFGASREPGEPNHAGTSGAGSLWWTWTAPTNGIVTVTASGLGSDTGLGVYAGASVSNLTVLGSGTSRNPSQLAKVALNVAVGAVCQIAVDGNYGSYGDITLSLSFTPGPVPTDPPPNDLFENATPLSGTNVLLLGNNLAATNQPGEPSLGYYAAKHSVWWTWTAPADGTAVITGTETRRALGRLVGFFTGPTVSNLVAVGAGCNFRGCEQYTFGVSAGVTYAIAVDSEFGPGGDISLLLRFLPPPPNDYFTNRIAIAGYTNVTGYNYGATIEAQEPRPGGMSVMESVWWSWTAPENASVSVSLLGSPSGSSALAVYAGNVLTNLSLVASNVSTADRVVTFNATAGATYELIVGSHLVSPILPAAPGEADATYQVPAGSDHGVAEDIALSFFANVAPQVTILSPADHSAFTPGVDIPILAEAFDADGNVTNLVISGYNLYQSCASSPCSLVWTNVPLGTYTLNAVATDDRGAPSHALPVTIHVAASNNDFESRQPLFAALPATGSTLGASKQPGEPNHAGNAGGASLWWTWTAPVAGNVLLSTEGSRFDTLLAVYTGGAVSNLTLVAANDSVTPFALHSEVPFRAEAGVEYQIALDGAAGAVGDFNLLLSPGAPNDHFADRIWIADFSQPVTGANPTASRQPAEPFHGFGFGWHSVWWSWTAPHSGSFTLSTAGSSFDTLLGIYRGGALDTLAAVAGNDDTAGLVASRVRFDAVAGEIYSIAVDGSGEATGNIVLTLTANPPTSFGLLNRTGEGVVEFQITGEAGRTNVVEASTNLVDWIPLGSVLNVNGRISFTDLTATNYNQRFYRAVLVP
jgi:hypothetical protein